MKQEFFEFCSNRQKTIWNRIWCLVFFFPLSLYRPNTHESRDGVTRGKLQKKKKKKIRIKNRIKNWMVKTGELQEKNQKKLSTYALRFVLWFWITNNWFFIENIRCCEWNWDQLAIHTNTNITCLICGVIKRVQFEILLEQSKAEASKKADVLFDNNK